jgi:prepilin-type processing-associated H-X9-DG protein/prepilin-type N-terminal cleavage/methylation domain-containing protein
MVAQRRVRWGFTLIELIVVIAITGILLTLLLPAISRARSAAKSTVCRSNLKQLGYGLHQYIDVWAGHLMPVSTFDWFVPGTSSLYWFGEVLPASTPGELSQVDQQKGFLMPFIDQTGAIEQCPEFIGGTFHFRFQRATGGYAYNYSYLGPGIRRDWPDGNLIPPVTHRLQEVARPSETIAFADSARIQWWSPPATDAKPLLEENFFLEPPSNAYPTVHFRHSGTANVLFLDGRVEAISPAINEAPMWWPLAVQELYQQRQLFDVGTDDRMFDRR